MYTSILFDKDGCLLDFDKTWGNWARDYLQDLSKGDEDLARKLADSVGYDPEKGTFYPDSPVVAGTPEDGVRLVLPHLPDWNFEALLTYSNQSAAKARLEPVVALEPFLKDLKSRGLILGIATNDAQDTARAHMRALGVEAMFDRILGSDSGFGGKPDCGMQRAFLEEFSLDPAQSLMVGDSLHDLHSGRAAQMVCVGVLTGPAQESELAPHADVLLQDIGGLPDWLNAQGTV